MRLKLFMAARRTFLYRSLKVRGATLSARMHARDLKLEAIINPLIILSVHS